MSQNGTAAAAMTQNMNTVGFGYGLAIAVGILVLVSTIMLASYVCVRVHGRGAGTARVRGISNEQGGHIGTSIQAREDVVPQVNDSAPLNSRDAGNASMAVGHGDNWAIGGLDEATLESYPKFRYAEKKIFCSSQHADETSCSICLADYCNGDLIRMLPDCGHSFHAMCVDAWLRLHASCPMCRTSPLPTPIATPLSELIPLARHPLHSHHR